MAASAMYHVKYRKMPKILKRDELFCLFVAKTEFVGVVLPAEQHLHSPLNALRLPLVNVL